LDALTQSRRRNGQESSALFEPLRVGKERESSINNDTGNLLQLNDVGSDTHVVGRLSHIIAKMRYIDEDVWLLEVTEMA